MPTSLDVESTVRNETAWESVAKKLFDSGPVGIMKFDGDKYTIWGRVTGYVDDPTYGRLIQIQAVDELGKPVLKPDTPSKDVGGMEKGVGV